MKSVCTFLLLLCCTFASAQRLHAVKDNALCLFGFQNDQNEWVYEPQFEHTSDGNNYDPEFWTVFKNGKMGLLWEDNSRYIEPEHAQIELINDSLISFSDTLHAVGLKTLDGRVIFAPEWSRIISAGEDKLSLRKNSQFFLGDIAGNVSNQGYNNFFARKGEIAVAQGRTGKGLVNMAGDTLIPFAYDAMQLSKNHNVVVAENDGLYTLFSLQGKRLFKSDFNHIKPSPTNQYQLWIEPPFVLASEGSWSITDRSGDKLITKGWSSLEPAARGTLIVSKNGRYGLLSPTGKKQTRIAYNKLENAGGSTETGAYFSFVENGLTGIINGFGETVVPAEYEWLEPTNQQVWLGQREDKIAVLPAIGVTAEPWKEYVTEIGDNYHFGQDLKGLISSDGTIIFPPKCTWIHGTNDGYSFVQLGKHQGLLSPDGQWIAQPGDYRLVLPPICPADEYFDIAPVWGHNHNVGLLRTDGKLLIDTAYSAVYPQPVELVTGNGYTVNFWVKPEKHWGMIDTNGIWTIEPKYNEVLDFSELGWTVSTDAGVGIIDNEGAPRTRQDYKQLETWGDSLILAQTTGWGIRNIYTNEEVLPFRFTTIQSADFFHEAWTEDSLLLYDSNFKPIAGFTLPLYKESNGSICDYYIQGVPKKCLLEITENGIIGWRPDSANLNQHQLNLANNQMLYVWLNDEHNTDGYEYEEEYEEHEILGPVQEGDLANVGYLESLEAGYYPDRGYGGYYSESFYHQTVAAQTSSTLTYQEHTEQWYRANVWTEDNIINFRTDGKLLAPLPIVDLLDAASLPDISIVCHHRVAELSDAMDMGFELDCSQPEMLVHDAYTDFIPRTTGIEFLFRDSRLNDDTGEDYPAARVLLSFDELARFLNPAGPFGHLAN